MKLFKGLITHYSWHALYAKSKLVPLMPAGDISVGYYLYKSTKLFKGLITHYSLLVSVYQ